MGILDVVVVAVAGLVGIAYLVGSLRRVVREAKENGQL